jgi:glycosyltransferase 2 family protein
MADLVQEAQQPTARRGGRRNWLGWALVLLILTVLALTLDLKEVLATLARVNPVELAAILLLMTLDRLIMAWKWSLLLRVVEVRLPLTAIVRFYYQGTLSGTFLPSQVGGDVLRAYWVSAASGVTQPVFASLVMEKIIGILSALSWAIVGLVVLASLMYPDGFWAWVALGVGAIGSVIAAFTLSMRAAVHDFILSRLGRRQNARIVGFLHRLYEAYARFSRAPWALGANVLITLGEQALQVVVVFLVARSLGIEADALALLAAAAVHIMIYRIPVAPDNWGVGELTAIGVFGLIGISPEAAFSLMFLSHILQVVVVLPGLLFLLRPSHLSTRAPSSPTSDG